MPERECLGSKLTRTVAALGAGLLVLTACLGRAEPAPDTLSRYLDDLVAGRVVAAYDRTQLAELGEFTQGGAVSRAHFEALYRDDPVESYEILRVVRLDRRAPGRIEEQGTPEWDAQVRLQHASGPVEVSLGVLGEVLGQVTVVPVAIDVVTGQAAQPAIAVDGLTVDLSRAGIDPDEGRYRIVILPGRHLVTVNGQEIRLEAEPLRVLGGRARVTGSPTSGLPQSLVLSP